MQSQLPPGEPVKPIRPVAAWQGGKRALANRLIERIETIDHTRYIEPFVGMGGVFFRRRHRPKCEVINDLSRDVANLFRLLQRHYPQLLDTLKWQINSRSEFDRLMRIDPETMTDLERAARFLFLQKAGYGGKVSGRTFGTDYTRGARFDLTKLIPLLDDVHERLCRVQIECLTYYECISKYDRNDGYSLFYIDPPYWQCEDDYGAGMFGPEDFDRLQQQLAKLNGRFIMSINDVPEIREIFGGFDMVTADLNYTVGAKPKAVRELIISN